MVRQEAQSPKRTHWLVGLVYHIYCVCTPLHLVQITFVAVPLFETPRSVSDNLLGHHLQRDGRQRVNLQELVHQMHNS